MKLRLPALFVVLFTLSLSFSFAQAPTVISNTEFPTGAGSNGVAYGNNTYVTAFSYRIYLSSDGNKWHRATGLPAIAPKYIQTVTFGNGIFVAVGRDGLVLRSVDGENWTVQNAGTTQALADVGYFQGNFVAIGNNRSLLRSPDGITWTSLSIDAGVGVATDNLSSITYGNGVYAISARNSGGGGGYVYYSSTLAPGTWGRVNLNNINIVQYLNDRFFAFGASQLVQTSTNASSWTNISGSITQTLPGGGTVGYGTGDQIFGALYDGTRYIFYGNNGNLGTANGGPNGGVWTSTNGINLTLHRTGVTQSVSGKPLFANGRYLVSGSTGIITSTDGITYKYVTNTYNDFASNGSSYVGVGGIENVGIVFNSTDFTNWTNRTPASGVRALNGIVYANGKYTAVGRNTVVESTDNGVTWTQIATPANEFFKIAYGASRYVAVGQTSGAAGIIQYSPDGINWTTANTDNNYFFKVKYLNGRFIAVGMSNDLYTGVIYQSTDGISWTDITPTLAFPVNYFHDVVYDGSKYHFMGVDDAYLFFSISTATPAVSGSFANKGTINSAIEIGGSFGEGAFAAVNGHFAGALIDNIDYKTYVVYSNDGITWTPVAIDENSNINAAIAETNRVLLMGSADGKITITFNTTLPVHFSGFTAQQAGKNVLLTWQTATEQNSDHFTVQHSTDAINWQNITDIDAAGQSNQQRDYTYTHTSPAKGRNYYRIAQTDRDGRQQLTDIKTVAFRDDNSIQLYPNPAKDWVEVRLTDNTPALVRIIDITGNVVFQHNYPANAVIRIPVEKLSKGSYQLQVVQSQTTVSRQLIRQ
jgi:hypothetical protein